MFRRLIAVFFVASALGGAAASTAAASGPPLTPGQGTGTAKQAICLTDRNPQAIAGGFCSYQG
jgi:hypothetical protein